MKRDYTHKVISAGLSEYYQETAEGKHCGTEDQCKQWVSEQEHPEYYDVTYSTEEFKRRDMCRRLFGEADPELSEREDIALDVALNMKEDYEKRLGRDAEAAANYMENFINNMGCPMTEFVEKMIYKHRTLQQSFTKLCMKWIEKVASDEYTYDGRNEGSHKTCKRLLDNWVLPHPDDKPHMDADLLKNSPPSKWLPMI